MKSTWISLLKKVPAFAFALMIAAVAAPDRSNAANCDGLQTGDHCFRLPPESIELYEGIARRCGSRTSCYKAELDIYAAEGASAEKGALRNMHNEIRAAVLGYCESRNFHIQFIDRIQLVACSRDGLNVLKGDAKFFQELRADHVDNTGPLLHGQMKTRNHVFSRLVTQACGNSASNTCFDRTMASIRGQMESAYLSMADAFGNYIGLSVLSRSCSRANSNRRNACGDYGPRISFPWNTIAYRPNASPIVIPPAQPETTEMNFEAETITVTPRRPRPPARPRPPRQPQQPPQQPQVPADTGADSGSDSGTDSGNADPATGSDPGTDAGTGTGSGETGDGPGSGAQGDGNGGGGEGDTPGTGSGGTEGNGNGSGTGDGNGDGNGEGSGDSEGSGQTGASGPSGAQGQSGVSGASGPSGAQGQSGASGASGASGPSGAQGQSGASGASGPSGSSGGSEGGSETGSDSGSSDGGGVAGGTGDTEIDCTPEGRQEQLRMMRDSSMMGAMNRPLGRAMYYYCRVQQSHSGNPSAMFLADAAVGLVNALIQAQAFSNYDSLRAWCSSAKVRIDGLLANPDVPGKSDLRVLREFIDRISAMSESDISSRTESMSAVTEFRTGEVQPALCPWKGAVEANDPGSTRLFPRDIAECPR